MIAMLLAVFTVASVAHASSAASMSAEMTVMQADDAGVAADCDDCDGGDEAGALSCDAVCVSPMLAMADGASWAPPSLGEAPEVAHRDLAGRASVPDPSPPRTTILS